MRYNPVISTLMILTLGIGVASSMTTLTVLRILSGSPIGPTGEHLYFVQVEPSVAGAEAPWLPWSMQYADAMNLLEARRAPLQAVMTMGEVAIRQTGSDAGTMTPAWYTTRDFFALFNLPIAEGHPWDERDDQSGARVAVISAALRARLFGAREAIGRRIEIEGQPFEVVGVIGRWRQSPEIFKVPMSARAFGTVTDVFIPLRASRGASLPITANINCAHGVDRQHLEQNECRWLTMWVRLDDEAQVRTYRDYLQSYDAVRFGAAHIDRQPQVSLTNVPALWRLLKVVPTEVRIQNGLAFGFLAICVLNTIGLLLARYMRRSPEIGIRRAMGATRRTVFYQFIVESGFIGVIGGMLGVVLTVLLLAWMRRRPEDYASLIGVDLVTIALTVAVAVLASMAAGLFPAWRASRVSAAWQIKAGA